MRTNKGLIFGVVLLFLIFAVVDGNKVCYHAKTCVHNGNEKCGMNGKGEYRRFLDSCDIKEYNCLKNTDYEKSDMANCASLPSIPNEEKKHK